MSTKRKTNITFSVDTSLLHKAKRQAAIRDVSLNHAFLEWLEQFSRSPLRAEELEDLFKEFSSVNAGRKFTRDESYE